MRTFFKYFLAVVAVLVMIPGLGMLSASLLIGNVDAVTGTAELVLNNDQARMALGEAFVEHLTENANPQDVAALKQSRIALTDAATQGIKEQTPAIVAELRKGYSAFIHDSAATVDFAPMLQGIQTRMHEVNARIPAEADVSNASVDLKSNSGAGIVLIVFTVGASWFVIAFSLLLLIGVAVLSTSKGLRKALIPGICLAIVGAWWLLAGATLPSGVSSALDDPNTSSVARSVADVVTRQFLIIGGIALGLGAVLILLSIFVTSKPRPAEQVMSSSALN
jgi:hypothetical protein